MPNDIKWFLIVVGSVATLIIATLIAAQVLPNTSVSIQYTPPAPAQQGK